MLDLLLYFDEIILAFYETILYNLNLGLTSSSINMSGGFCLAYLVLTLNVVETFLCIGNCMSVPVNCYHWKANKAIVSH